MNPAHPVMPRSRFSRLLFAFGCVIAFIVGGGVSDEGELVLDPIRKSFRRWLIGGDWRPHAQVLAAQLGGTAGLVGAADLARQG